MTLKQFAYHYMQNNKISNPDKVFRKVRNAKENEQLYYRWNDPADSFPESLRIVVAESIRYYANH